MDKKNYSVNCYLAKFIFINDYIYIALKETIILVIPNHFKIYKAFVANLEKMGFEIILLFTCDEEFRYEKFSQKITNFFRKTFLGDRNYKENLKNDYDDERLVKVLSNLHIKANYALVIRPDYLSKQTIQLLKKKTDHLVAYQWDGIDRYPKVKDLIVDFDRFFLFDEDDYEKYKSTYNNLYPITNFYFDFEFSGKATTNEKLRKSVFFIGSFVESRMQDILNITKIFNELDFNININLLCFDENTPLKYKQSEINFIDKSLTYLEVLEEVKNADLVLDFVDPVHKGLSFRIFETLQFSKKLITNNPLVKNYDFYSLNNILVWEKYIDQVEIKEFLLKEYEEIDKEIVAKYSFTSWINYILK